MEEYPFEPFANDCHITFSQEEKLRKCRFEFESDDEETSPPCSVQVTGIVMVSPPESNTEYLEEDVFHTPPEDHRSQSMSGSEDQGPEIRPAGENDVGGCDEEVLVAGGFTDAEKTVDLGKDSDTLGFLEPNFVDKIDSDDYAKDVVCGHDVLKIDRERTVDLGKDSDTKIDGVDCVKDVVCYSDLSKVEIDLKKYKVLESECGQSILDKSNVSTENMQPASQTYLGDTEPIVIESENVEIGETEVFDLALEKTCKGMGTRVNENTENVDQRVKGTNSGGHSASKNIADLDAFKYVSSGGVGKKGDPVRRQLPNSFEPEENEGLWVPRQSLKDKKTFKDCSDAAGISNDDNNDTNFLKTAKKRGLTFYQPRWWSPEGFGDPVMD